MYYFTILGIMFPVVLLIVLYNSFRKEKALFEDEKRRVELLSNSFSGLTSISGARSALNHIAESLKKFGFEKVLILTVDKENKKIVGDISLGFKEEFNPSDYKFEVEGKPAGIIKKTFFEQNFLVFDKGEKEPKIEKELSKYLKNDSLMLAPISRKKESNCFELTRCNKTKCPAYESKDNRCWLKPDTKCPSHLHENYDVEIFKDPDKKIKACLDCEAFHCLGTIIVTKPKNYKFSEEEKNLFHTFAYQAGAVLEKGYLLTNLELREKELQRRMYELSILKELGDRIGYSLNVEKIVDIITSSLVKLLDYSVVSYMLLKPDKVQFKCTLEESVSEKFIDDIRKRMTASLSALMNQEFKSDDVDTILSGTIIDNTKSDPVNSFFNIPIVIADKTVGLLTVASTRPGLYKGDEVNILYKITAQASNAVSRLQSVLEAEKGKLNDMVVSMVDGIIMVDKENRLTVINPIAKRMLGIEEADPTIFNVINAFQGKIDIRSKIEESLKLNKTLIIDEVALEDLKLQVFITPVKPKTKLSGSKNEPLGAVVLMHDVTKEKEIEKMKSEFVSVASHQLRTPLSAIKWFLEMLINGDAGELNTEQLEYLSQAYESNERMVDLVNSLLNISRIESGRLSVEPELTDIIKLSESAFSEAEIIANEKSQKITFIKPTEKIKKVKTDPKLFRQVLQNLLSNAIKYTPEKGKITLKISMKNEDELLFEVSDNGLGIPEDQQDKMFQKFFRADNVLKNEVEGTGLGLYVVKSIIETLGGKIRFKSAENRGATFWCTLPIKGSKARKGDRTLMSTRTSEKYHYAKKN